MGAASSISIDNQNINNVYISYDNTSPYNYLKILCPQIERLGFNVTTSELTKLYELKNIEFISNNIEVAMKTCKYLIVFLSNSTIKSFLQTIELNIALDYRDKIIYILTEKDLSPITNGFIRGIIKDNKYFRCYDESTLTSCINEIMDILDN